MALFQFKAFSITQENTAMKVGTDGVLLGAWVSLNNTTSVLDIGTGTGLISLMLCQRCELVKVKAIEVEEGAAKDAKCNFEASAWSDRLELVVEDVQHYIGDEVDLIVSNPPFFEESYLSENKSRSTARNQESLSIESLFLYAQQNANRLAVIYPFVYLDEIKSLCEQIGWKVNRVCFVKPTPTKAVKRVLVELSKTSEKYSEEELVIEDKGRHQYSDAYISLTKDFYLKM